MVDTMYPGALMIKRHTATFLGYEGFGMGNYHHFAPGLERSSDWPYISLREGRHLVVFE